MEFSKKEIDRLIEICREHKISAYLIGEESFIKQSTANRILTGRTKNPSTTSLIEIKNVVLNRHPEYFDQTGKLIFEDSLESTQTYSKFISIIDELDISPNKSQKKDELIEFFKVVLKEKETVEKFNNRLKDACQHLLGIYANE